MYKKTYSSQSSEIYLRYSKLVQHSKIGNPSQQAKKEKSHDHTIRCRKIIWQNPILIRGKNSP